MENKTLIISLPSVWAIKNFIYSGFLKEAKNIYRIVLLVPEGSAYEGFIEKTSFSIIYYPVVEESTFENVLLRSIKISHLKSHSELNNSKLVSNKFTFKLYPKNGETIKGKLLVHISWLLTHIFPLKKLITLYKIFSIEKKYKHVLDKISMEDSAILIATNIIVKHEMKLFIQFENLKNKKINFINSFDNTTSRGFLPFFMFDYQIVWNEKMKGELIKLFSIKSDSIFTLGTPHFDLLYKSRIIKLEINDNLYKIVEDNYNYILYCAGHYSLLPFEVDLLEDIVEKIYSNETFKDIYFIIRLHPLDSYERWEKFRCISNKIILDMPWKQNPTNPVLSLPDPYDFSRYARIINNANIVLNIGSTATLDSCVLGKPVFNLFFGSSSAKKQMEIIYDSIHFKPIIENKASSLIYSIDELIDILNEYLGKGTVKSLTAEQNKYANEYSGFNSKNTFFERFEHFISSENFNN